MAKFQWSVVSKSIIPMMIYLVLVVFSACSDTERKTRPTVGTLTESVYASVTVSPEDMYDVYPASSGILKEISVTEGDTVRRGQVIAKIVADNPAVLRENARLNADLARENYLGKANMLESMAEEIRSAREQLELDSLNYARLNRLWEQKIGSKSNLEKAELRYTTGQNNLDILRSKYIQTKNQLANTYQQSQNTLKQAQTSLGDFNITSRIDGKVYAVHKEAGESINTQQPLASIGSMDTYLIEMAIDEVDIARIRIGQRIWITLDAYENEVFEALLTRIVPLKDERTQTFQVEAQFIESPTTLYAGLSGEANIVLHRIENAITIPLDYLIDNDHVLTEDGEVQVTVGLKNLDAVEILSGLDSSTVIILPE